MGLRARLWPGLSTRSVWFEVLLAVLGAFSVGAVQWTSGPAPVPLSVTTTASVGVGLLLLLLRRRAPLVPFLAAAAVGAVAPAVGGAIPLGAYAVGRYTAGWPARAVAGVAGSVAVSQLWTGGSLGDVVSGLAGAAFVVLLPGTIGAWVRARADLMTALTERAERAEAERELLAREAIAAERARIAREMHDAVGHRVSLMVLQAGAIEMAAADRGRVEQLACHVQLAGRQALDELRQAVGVLRDGEDDGAPLTPQPGLEDLERLVEECRAAGMVVELTGRPADAAPVEPAVSRAAYRVVQEALTNAGKHAPGAPVHVDVSREPDRLVLRVVNGTPTEPAARGAGGGFGLVGLSERVRTLDGRLRTEHRLDGGFLVEAVIPA
ncbi:Signal transduction histidine kinase [Geodermatophilus telluris]|uniref:histidine kinase n=1 Tax=Geodermatophilus telluris TaxID=1190417 RepID=A0A1G6ULQ3_9ACTN|nr:histidine kinase [Geodermatophilus telluris]SDD41507.1 Signal transduction histidine kinase [Geodermatophilus telluris]